MSRPLFVFLVLLLCIAIFLLMWWGWRARAKRDSVLALPAQQGQHPAADENAEVFTEVQYVATTPAGAPYERVMLDGLKYRGHAQVQVGEAGVLIAVNGEKPVPLGRELLTGWGRATSRVGKTVEKDGLTLLKWRVPADAAGAAAAGAATASTPENAGERELESAFRFPNPAEAERFTRAVEGLLAVPSAK